MDNLLFHIGFPNEQTSLNRIRTVKTNCGPSVEQFTSHKMRIQSLTSFQIHCIQIKKVLTCLQYKVKRTTNIRLKSSE